MCWWSPWSSSQPQRRAAAQFICLTRGLCVWRDCWCLERRESGSCDRMLTSWVLPLDSLQTSRKHTHKYTLAHTEENAQTNIHVQLVDTNWKHRASFLSFPLVFGWVCLLSQQLYTYQATVIPKPPLYLTSSCLPSLICLSQSCCVFYQVVEGQNPSQTFCAMLVELHNKFSICSNICFPFNMRLFSVWIPTLFPLSFFFCFLFRFQCSHKICRGNVMQHKQTKFLFSPVSLLKPHLFLVTFCPKFLFYSYYLTLTTLLCLLSEWLLTVSEGSYFQLPLSTVCF